LRVFLSFSPFILLFLHLLTTLFCNVFNLVYNVQSLLQMLEWNSYGRNFLHNLILFKVNMESTISAPAILYLALMNCFASFSPTNLWSNQWLSNHRVFTLVDQYM
jgi:hypothetical protein